MALDLVIDEREARHIAEGNLEGLVARTRVVNAGFEEYPIGWAYFWQSAKYLESGHIGDALAGNAPILVRRSDGAVLPTGKAEPLDYYIEQHERRAARERAVSGFDRLLTATVDELSAIGPTMTIPVVDRVRDRYPDAPILLVDEAVARAQVVGERALELTRADHNDETVTSALRSEYPAICPPVWPRLRYRADYWWK